MELSRIVIGAMRFKDRKSAINVIRFAIDCGFNYIDTCGICEKRCPNQLPLKKIIAKAKELLYKP
jgi:predicted aldo/keto reductase-like oxidoreductase